MTEGVVVRTVEERVVHVVAEKMGCPEGDVRPEKSFVNDLGADSLDTVEILMGIEDEFDLSIPEEEAQKISIVADAIKYVKEHKAPPVPR